MLRLNPDTRARVLEDEIRGSEVEIDTISGELDKLNSEVGVQDLPPQSLFERMAKLLSLNSKLFNVQSRYEELVAMRQRIEAGKKHKPR